MEHPAGSPTSPDPFERLAALGPDLAVERRENGVRWSLAGRSAVATFVAGVVEAVFVDRETVDEASRARVAAVYIRPQVRYGLDPAGCARMVDDLVAFFSGSLEPRFAFATVEERHRSV